MNRSNKPGRYAATLTCPRCGAAVPLWLIAVYGARIRCRNCRTRLRTPRYRPFYLRFAACVVTVGAAAGGATLYLHIAHGVSFWISAPPAFVGYIAFAYFCGYWNAATIARTRELEEAVLPKWLQKLGFSEKHVRRANQGRLPLIALVLLVVATAVNVEYRNYQLSVTLGGDLHRAVCDDNLPEVVRLLDAGAPVDAEKEYSRFTWMEVVNMRGGWRRAPQDRYLDVYTPLAIASRRGVDTNIVLALLEHGADIGRGEKWGGTVLHIAASCHNRDIAAALLRHGADVNEHPDDWRGTPLMCAANSFTGDVLGTVSVLIDNGADVDRTNNAGVTALMRAALYCDETVVERLLDGGADINAACPADVRGVTALSFAARAGKSDTVSLLLARGADPNPNDGMRRCTTPLLSAATSECEGAPDTVRILIERGANIHRADEYGRTPLFLAAHNATHATNMLPLLINAGSDVNDHDNNGRNALFELTNAAAARMLIEYGADVNHVDGRGATPLASIRYMTTAADIYRALLENGANPEHADLASQVLDGKIDTVRVLLEHGADPNGPAGVRGRHLDTAIARGYTNIAALLIEYGARTNAP